LQRLGCKTAVPEQFINDMLDRVDIVDALDRHVQLKKVGMSHKGLCPFHSEKTPSFIVSSRRQTYKCFGCGVHGNAIGFLMDHLGLGFVDAVSELAQQAGMTVSQHWHAPAGKPRKTTLSAREALTVIRRDALTCAIVAIDSAKGKAVSPTDRASVIAAAARIERLCEEFA
jgi:DNA primase catalytic core